MFTDKNERKLAIARQLIADMPAYALDEAIDRIAYIRVGLLTAEYEKQSKRTLL